MLFLIGLITVSVPSLAVEIPLFARRYGVDCSRCHVAPPKLNRFGEEFVARGYVMPELLARRSTWPFAVWASARSDAVPAVNGLRTYLNRLEIISGGKLVRPSLWYFVEWRAVSLETRGDGSLRDRSGRFEDLFLSAAAGSSELTAGQFRLVAQVDVSRRLGLSEPLVLSSSVPGSSGARARETSLRGFAPAGRSPALRAAWHQPIAGGWRWTTSLAVPFPGELSIPLTGRARVEASNELVLSAKGVIIETFARRGLFSVGGHAFYDHSERFLAQAITTGRHGPVHWTGIIGAARFSDTTRNRWSVEGEYVPWSFLGAGSRVENLSRDGRPPAVVAYLNAHFPGTRYTIRLTVERRFERDRGTTLVELGTVF